MSNVFSPVLTPTYGVLLALTFSVLTLLPLQTKVWVTVITFLITGGFPVIGIGLLYLTKRISHPSLNKREERTLPYILTMVAYLGAAFYLYKISAPAWLYSMPLGGALAVVVSIVVNHWWKISAHLAAIGGVLAMLFQIVVRGYAMPGIFAVIVVTVLLTGLLATSRIVLGRHTPWQTVAGAANGFLCVWIVSIIFC